MFWHYAIGDVGAGLSTVLGNLQVVVVPFARVADPGRADPAALLAALPLVCSGIVLISGVLETGAYGDDPARGVMFGILTGLDLRRLHPRAAPGQLRPAPPRRARCSTPRCVATVVAAIAGLAIGEVDFVPAWPAHGWLVVLALTSQVLGWLLITVSLPRLPAALTSVTLDDPARRLGAAGRDPARRGRRARSSSRGVACILAGLVSVALRRDPSRRPVPEPA